MEDYKVSNFQSLFSNQYYVILKNHLYNYRLRRYAINRLLKKNTHNMILEIGSGISPIVSLVHNNVIYSDVSLIPLMLLKKYYPHALIVAADVTLLPFKANSLSLTICSEVLEHIKDDRKALEEISRTLKPSGSIIITFPHGHHYFSYDDRFVHHQRRYELYEMIDMLNNAGLKPEYIKKVLGPLEKITMIIACFIFQKIRMTKPMSKKYPGRMRFLRFLSWLFKWANLFYAFFIWVDAHIIPLKWASVILVKSKK
ncbi:MAG TPA: hypothetical protein DDW17_01155 [Deltaproteobacteria bacterium]|nr:hypothetical protein [Deltaproteobacteria bacterium]